MTTRSDDNEFPSGDDERFEHIPWEQITPIGNRNMVLYALAGAIVVAALVAAAFRGGPVTAQPLAAPTTSNPDAVPTPTVTATVATTAPPVTTAPASEVDGGRPAPQTWSEADLFAFSAESLAAEAGAIAEWVASDFFTIDGGVEITQNLTKMLPEGSALPAAAAGSRSFVEWARAVSVQEPAPGRYQVLVVVRRLGAADGESYRRVEPVGVLVTLAWTQQGWSVTDLPALAASPSFAQAPAWSQTEVPAHIADAVAASTGGEIIGGTEVGEAWRLVVRLNDQVGNSWPLVVWSDKEGNPIEVPGQDLQP